MNSRRTVTRSTRFAMSIGLAGWLMSSVSSAQEMEASAGGEVGEENAGQTTEMGADGAVAPEPTPAPAPAPAPEPAPAEIAPEPSPEPLVASEPTEEPPPDAAAEPESRSAGVNVDVGIATIYNFRGWNTFKETSQQDQNALFAPSVTWSMFDTGLLLGYWGAYQLTGKNQTANVDVALGHEQDLYFGYGHSFANDLLSLSLLFTYYFYPFADEDAAGTSNPSIIEPMLGFSIATAIDIGFSVSYFHALQSEIKGLRHAYFRFSLGKGFDFNDTFGMSIGASFGAKAWIEDNDTNRFDLLFDWSVPIHLTEQLYLTPAIHLGWTDLESISAGLDDDLTTPAIDESSLTRKARAGDEFMVYGSVNVGADF